MKRTHTDDLQNKNKRFSYPTSDGMKKMNMPQGGPSPGPPGGPGSSPYGYGYQGGWVDPRMDPRGHGNMGMFNPQWNNGAHSHTQPPPPQQQNYSAIYNPLQPPPPPTLPPIDTPPPPPTSRPPPPVNQHMHMLPHMQNPNALRRPPLNNNLRRRPPMNNLMPGPSGYMNNNPYKRNDRFQNHGMQKNGSNYNHNNPNSSSPGLPKPKGDKSEDGDKLKRNFNGENFSSLKVNKKARRKPMSERYTCKKEWNKDDAVRALTLENAYNHLIKKVPMLILRFPDPELNKGLIHSYSPAIETVHFQQPSRARYCFVQLKADADIEAVKQQISDVKFGTGKISVENKVTRHEVAEVTPEQLDPYTLYVGNLPTKLNVTIFKEKFPTAKRIDIGYAQRTKFTRYAFLHYDNVDESMEAFKSTYNLTIDARSLVVRFRRNKGSVGLSEKGKKIQKTDGGDEKKPDGTKDPQKTRVFDDEWNVYENKDNVLKEAEELRKSGFAEVGSTKENLFGSKIKEEPVEPIFEEEDDCMSDEYGDAYGEAFVDGDGFDEDDAFCHSDYDGSENEYSMNDTENGPDSSGTKVFGKRHWERSDPKTVVKQEKPDDYIAPIVDTGKDIPVEPEREKRQDELDDLFSGLNPEDEVEL